MNKAGIPTPEEVKSLFKSKGLLSGDEGDLYVSLVGRFLNAEQTKVQFEKDVKRMLICQEALQLHNKVMMDMLQSTTKEVQDNDSNADLLVDEMENGRLSSVDSDDLEKIIEINDSNTSPNRNSAKRNLQNPLLHSSERSSEGSERSSEVSNPSKNKPNGKRQISSTVPTVSHNRVHKKYTESSEDLLFKNRRSSVSDGSHTPSTEFTESNGTGHRRTTSTFGLHSASNSKQNKNEGKFDEAGSLHSNKMEAKRAGSISPSTYKPNNLKETPNQMRTGTTLPHSLKTASNTDQDGDIKFGNSKIQTVPRKSQRRGTSGLSLDSYVNTSYVQTDSLVSRRKAQSSTLQRGRRASERISATRNTYNASCSNTLQQRTDRILTRSALATGPNKGKNERPSREKSSVGRLTRSKTASVSSAQSNDNALASIEHRSRTLPERYSQEKKRKRDESLQITRVVKRRYSINSKSQESDSRRNVELTKLRRKSFTKAASNIQKLIQMSLDSVEYPNQPRDLFDQPPMHTKRRYSINSKSQESDSSRNVEPTRRKSFTKAASNIQKLIQMSSDFVEYPNQPRDLFDQPSMHTSISSRDVKNVGGFIVQKEVLKYSKVLKLHDLGYNKAKRQWEVLTKWSDEEALKWEPFSTLHEDITEMMKKFLDSFPDKKKVGKALGYVSEDKSRSG